ncbi:2Fe-2S ferredoxin [Hyphomonas sp. CACIAM 19H1]|uniref:2Fe-2S iron-sulfur cluster-binding protein n=1 Tax=Hyphomonas sp. CACIAM 19H1 TaxID=1873716 RepID=UPI000DEDB74E|nr:2Fe-2S iron-sulfur cluster-binding protein [Hyphomonas sp. CACIAM 19H1]AXE64656.1 2Fe-2S ferredoxin [Hyphomonas sp. CACIAM 19H1]
MVRIEFVTPSGHIRQVEAQDGETLMQAAVRHQIEGIEAACGGAMSCGTCHAWVLTPWNEYIAAPQPDEREILDFGVHIRADSRLTCQIKVSSALEGARIEVPPSQS